MRTFILILTCAVWLTADAAHAAWSNDPATNLPIESSPQHQRIPEGVSDGSGGAIFVWQDTRTNFNQDLYAQRVLWNGQLAWSSGGQLVHTVTTTAMDTYHFMVKDGAGGAIVTWARGQQVRAQRLNGLGEALWGADGVLLASAFGSACVNKCIAAHAISDGAQGVIIVWEDLRNDPNPGDGNLEGDIFAQRVGIDGSLIWGSAAVPICTASNMQKRPRLVPDLEGGAVVLWEDFRNGQQDVFAQRVDANGNRLWSPSNGIPVTSTLDPEYNIEVVPDGAGGAVVTWTNSGPVAQAWGQRLNKTGQVLWMPNGTTIPNIDNNRRMVPDGSGGAIVVSFYSGEGGDVLAHRLSGDGQHLWGNSGVTVCGVSGSSEANVIPTDDGGAIVTFDDKRNTLDNGDIYAQRLDADGATLWIADGVQVSTANDVQFSPAIVPSLAGSAIIAWQDRRNYSTFHMDVYSQQISAAGVLGDAVSDVAHSETPSVRLSVGSPVRQETTAHLVLPWASPLTMRIFDIAGRQRDILRWGITPAGVHALPIEVRQYAAGVYVVQFEGAGFRIARKFVRLRN